MTKIAVLLGFSGLTSSGGRAEDGRYRGGEGPS